MSLIADLPKLKLKDPTCAFTFPQALLRQSKRSCVLEHIVAGEDVYNPKDSIPFTIVASSSFDVDYDRQVFYVNGDATISLIDDICIVSAEGFDAKTISSRKFFVLQPVIDAKTVDIFYKLDKAEEPIKFSLSVNAIDSSLQNLLAETRKDLSLQKRINAKQAGEIITGLVKKESRLFEKQMRYACMSCGLTKEEETFQQILQRTKELHSQGLYSSPAGIVSDAFYKFGLLVKVPPQGGGAIPNYLVSSAGVLAEFTLDSPLKLVNVFDASGDPTDLCIEVPVNFFLRYKNNELQQMAVLSSSGLPEIGRDFIMGCSPREDAQNLITIIKYNFQNNEEFKGDDKQEARENLVRKYFEVDNSGYLAEALFLDEVLQSSLKKEFCRKAIDSNMKKVRGLWGDFQRLNDNFKQGKLKSPKSDQVQKVNRQILGLASTILATIRKATAAYVWSKNDSDLWGDLDALHQEIKEVIEEKQGIFRKGKDSEFIDDLIKTAEGKKVAAELKQQLEETAKILKGKEQHKQNVVKTASLAAKLQDKYERAQAVVESSAEANEQTQVLIDRVESKIRVPSAFKIDGHNIPTEERITKLNRRVEYLRDEIPKIERDLVRDQELLSASKDEVDKVNEMVTAGKSILQSNGKLLDKMSAVGSSLSLMSATKNLSAVISGSSASKQSLNDKNATLTSSLVRQKSSLTQMKARLVRCEQRLTELQEGLNESKREDTKSAKSPKKKLASGAKSLLHPAGHAFSELDAGSRLHPKICFWIDVDKTSVYEEEKEGIKVGKANFDLFNALMESKKKYEEQDIEVEIGIATARCLHSSVGGFSQTKPSDNPLFLSELLSLFQRKGLPIAEDHIAFIMDCKFDQGKQGIGAYYKNVYGNRNLFPLDDGSRVDAEHYDCCKKRDQAYYDFIVPALIQEKRTIDSSLFDELQEENKKKEGYSDKDAAMARDALIDVISTKDDLAQLIKREMKKKDGKRPVLHAFVDDCLENYSQTNDVGKINPIAEETDENIRLKNADELNAEFEAVGNKLVQLNLLIKQHEKVLLLRRDWALAARIEKTQGKKAVAGEESSEEIKKMLEHENAELKRCLKTVEALYPSPESEVSAIINDAKAEISKVNGITSNLRGIRRFIETHVPVPHGTFTEDSARFHIVDAFTLSHRRQVKRSAADSLKACGLFPRGHGDSVGERGVDLAAEAQRRTPVSVSDG